MSRIPPAEPPHPPEIAEQLARWMPPGAAVEPLALFRTLVRHPDLAQAMLPLGRFLLGRHARVPRREREIVIHRISARCGCAYEWGVHAAAFAAAIGLDDAQLRATAIGDANDPAWSGRDALLVRLADALHDGADVPDALWRDVAAAFSQEELLELLVLAGWYHVIAYVANGARVAGEPWAMALPAGD